MCARNTVCARIALKTVSDQTLPDGNDLCSDLNQTIVQTIARFRWTLIRLYPDQKGRWSDHFLGIFQPPPDHCPDYCATMAQTKPRPLSRHLCTSDDLWSDYPRTKNATDQTNFSTSSLKIIFQTNRHSIGSRSCLKWTKWYRRLTVVCRLYNNQKGLPDVPWNKLYI